MTMCLGSNMPVIGVDFFGSLCGVDLNSARRCLVLECRPTLPPVSQNVTHDIKSVSDASAFNRQFGQSLRPFIQILNAE